MIKYDNLHCHTTNSDGKLTVKETVKFCEENNINAVAFTDHDSLLKKSDIDYLKSYKGDVKWVSGIEISVGGIPEIDSNISDFHLVGLFVDPTNQKLIDFCKKTQYGRKERMQRMVRNLKSIGINITEEDCLEASNGEVVGRPHIVKAIMKYESNVKRMEELYEQMKEDSKTNQLAKEKLQVIQEQGNRQKPYMIFLSKDSYIRNIYVDYLFSPTLDQCVEIIRQAGGLSFLAHYFSISKKVDLDYIEKLLKEGGLDGVEVVYGLGMIDEEMKLQQEELKKIAQRTNCLVSGGSDIHTYDNWIEFLNDKEFANRTVGLLDNILKNSKKGLGWYNIL